MPRRRSSWRTLARNSPSSSSCGLSSSTSLHARPVRDGHQRGHRRHGVGSVEQARDIAARPRRPPDIAQPADPGRATADRARGPHPQEPVAECKAGFHRVLGQHVVAFVGQNPAWVADRLHHVMHERASPFRAGCATRRWPPGGDVDLVQAGHDEVGAGGVQQGLVAEAGDPERGHAGGARGRDAGRRVLDHQALRRRDRQGLGGQQEERGVRLAARHVAAAEVGVEDRQQRAPVGQRAGDAAWRRCSSRRRRAPAAARPRAGRRRGAPRPGTPRSCPRR